ncbi:MAG: PQQ-binding-like beta-propeller repeat protein [Planctomycetota bacterium]|nr:PQQ-binding-like beta-propeller repeat protein [Planctomycetota bacterium]
MNTSDLKFVVVLTSALILLVTMEAHAEDWTQWLGNRRDGVWRESGILEKFPEGGPKLLWKTSIGSGYSGPSISNGRVYVMDRIESGDSRTAKDLHEGNPPKNYNFVRKLIAGKERMLCLDEKTGDVLWSHQWDCPYTTVAAYAIGPRVTPTVDGGRVYALGAEGNFFCFDSQNGKVLWQRDFKKDYRLQIPEWGTAAHPLIDGDNVISIVGGKDTTVVAFDKKTGEEVWRALTSKLPGYCPPVIYTINGIRQLIIWHGDGLQSIDPKTGELFWTLDIVPTYGMSIGHPVLSGNKLFMMAWARVSACVEVADSGKEAKIIWEGNTNIGIGGVFCTAVIDDGFIYACGISGRYSCAKLEDGTKLWTTYQPATGKRPGAWGNVFTIQHEDRYFLANDLGDLIIANLSPDGYEEISRVHLIEPTHSVAGRTLVWSHPAFANRCIFLRNDKEIRCYYLGGDQ